MSNVRVFDLPTRVFHWAFAGLFVAAYAIGNFVDDEAALFNYHKLFGIVLAATVALRLIWMIAGTKHARITDFNLNPIALLCYLKGIVVGTKDDSPGHNAASSWAALIMIAMAIGLAVTGYMMTTGNESVEEIHDIFAQVFVATAGIHILGLIVHGFRYRDKFSTSMVNGRKDLIRNDVASVAPRKLAGVLYMALIAMTGIYVFTKYDAAAQTLNVFGTTYHLGEAEGGEGGERGGEQGESGDSDND